MRAIATALLALALFGVPSSGAVTSQEDACRSGSDRPIFMDAGCVAASVTDERPVCTKSNGATLCDVTYRLSITMPSDGCARLTFGDVMAWTSCGRGVRSASVVISQYVDLASPFIPAQTVELCDTTGGASACDTWTHPPVVLAAA